MKLTIACEQNVFLAHTEKATIAVPQVQLPSRRTTGSTTRLARTSTTQDAPGRCADSHTNAISASDLAIPRGSVINSSLQHHPHLQQLQE